MIRAEGSDSRARGGRLMGLPIGDCRLTISRPRAEHRQAKIGNREAAIQRRKALNASSLTNEPKTGLAPPHHVSMFSRTTFSAMAGSDTGLAGSATTPY